MCANWFARLVCILFSRLHVINAVRELPGELKYCTHWLPITPPESGRYRLRWGVPLIAWFSAGQLRWGEGYTSPHRAAQRVRQCRNPSAILLHSSSGSWHAGNIFGKVQAGAQQKGRVEGTNAIIERDDYAVIQPVHTKDARLRTRFHAGHRRLSSTCSPSSIRHFKIERNGGGERYRATLQGFKGPTRCIWSSSESEGSNLRACESVAYIASTASGERRM